MKLRPYQQTAVDALRASYASGKQAPLFVLPTGGGKTFVFSFVGMSAAARGKRVCVLVHRRELLLQASGSLAAMGVAHGLIAPGFKRTEDLVQVASVQTLARRLRSVAPFDLLIVDEAHHAAAGTWKTIRDAFPGAKLLGVTATPCRTDGRGLDDVFDDLISGPSIAELIEAGYLVPPVVYAPPVADLSKLKRRGGDFDPQDAADRLDRPTVTGDVIQHYRKLADGLPAIAFCSSVAHAQHVAAQFNEAGYRARAIDGGMNQNERAAAIAQLGSGELQVLTSCDLISEGTDIPAVAAAILLRPTQSLSLYIQQVGRALRPSPGKTQAIILDHVGNCRRFGMPDDPREWSLQGTPKRTRATDSVPAVHQCSGCYFVFRPAPVCPNCGLRKATKEREIHHTSGELIKIEKSAIKRDRRAEIGKARTLAELERIARERGYKPGWARFILQSRKNKAA